VPDDFRIPRGMPDALGYQRRDREASVLYRAVQHNLETFLASAQEQGRVVPRFVERELRAYLRCGILGHGFLRVRCDDCGRERLVAYSCKTRGFCPSCGARRMSDTAAHLVDRVFPEVPVRQYVLSLPFALHTRLAGGVVRTSRSRSPSPSRTARVVSFNAFDTVRSVGS